MEFITPQNAAGQRTLAGSGSAAAKARITCCVCFGSTRAALNDIVGVATPTVAESSLDTSRKLYSGEPAAAASHGSIDGFIGYPYPLAWVCDDRRRRS
jgi:hypothetical protein